MSMITCPECNQPVSSKAPTCPHCGIRIENNVKRCPKCNTYVMADASECPNCGAHFVVEEKPTPKPAAEQLQDESTYPADAVNEEADVVEEAPQKKDTPWYLLLLAILIIGIGAYLYWDNYQDKLASEEKAFELLKDCNDPLSFEDFIARFPNSKHIDEVKERLSGLQKEDAVWAELCRTLDVDALHNFVDTHPTSPYMKVALHKIDSLDWRRADQIGTKDAYDEYILQHEDGIYISEAYNARDNARRREEQARRDSLAAVAKRDSIAAAAAAETEAVTTTTTPAPAAE